MQHPEYFALFAVIGATCLALAAALGIAILMALGMREIPSVALACTLAGFTAGLVYVPIMKQF